MASLDYLVKSRRLDNQSLNDLAGYGDDDSRALRHLNAEIGV